MPYKNREDKNAYAMRRYYAGKDKYGRTQKQIQQSVKYNREKIRKRKRLIDIWKLKKGCEICGYKEHAVALDFHHRDETEKYVAVSAIFNAKIKRIFEEIRKCRLVCANCHRVLHKEERDGKKDPDGGAGGEQGI